MKYKIFLIYKFISEYSTHTYPYSATMLLSIIIILILHTFISFFGAGNSNSLQYSCLEKPMDKGIWWAIAHRVTKSLTQMKRLSAQALPKKMNNLRKDGQARKDKMSLFLRHSISDIIRS